MLSVSFHYFSFSFLVGSNPTVITFEVEASVFGVEVSMFEEVVVVTSVFEIGASKDPTSK